MDSITKEQADIVGEVANICTGNAATALMHPPSSCPIFLMRLEEPQRVAGFCLASPPSMEVVQRSCRKH